MKRKFGKNYHKRAIYKFLRRLGFRLKKPRPFHHKADEIKQEAFKEGMKDVLKKRY